MTVQALGYLGFGCDRLEDWSAFATGVLGLQRVDASAGSAAWRMDDRKQRLFVDAALPAGSKVFGWEMADAAALDALAARLEAAGTRVQLASGAEAAQRHVGGLIRFQDPAGNRLEAFHGAEVADQPFRPARDIAGFRTGAQGMGHVLMMVPDLQAALGFYQQLLGFRVSDYILAPVKAYFLHVNSRHHSLALVEGPMTAMHHLMMELYSFDDVGRGYDIAQQQEGAIAAKLGRHPNDLMMSFYSRTPADFLVEYGWGGRDVDMASWQPVEMQTVGSFWGHQGLFDALVEPPPPGAPPPPPEPVRRAPLQVMEGNYTRLQGVCPWWDAQKG